MGRLAAARIDHAGADHLHIDVVAHGLEQLFARFTVAQARIELVAVHQRQEILTRHDALTDGLHALVGVRRDDGAHQILRDFLLLDQDRRRGAVGWRPEHGYTYGYAHQRAGDEPEGSAPAPVRQELFARIGGRIL